MKWLDVVGAWGPEIAPKSPTKVGGILEIDIGFWKTRWEERKPLKGVKTINDNCLLRKLQTLFHPNQLIKDLSYRWNLRHQNRMV